MIWESGPWKREIWKAARKLDRRKRQRRWPQASLSALEIEFFGAFYAIRKLLDARKLSDGVVSQRLIVRTFPPTGTPVQLMNWDEIDKLYDLTASPPTEALTLRDFVNQVVHSYVFLPSASAEGLQGFFLASDHQRPRGLYYVEIDRVIQALRSVALDDIIYLHQVFDPSSGDWKILEAKDLSDLPAQALQRPT